MDTIGTFEAKTHLTRLLDRVASGEQITITRHGTPIARLVPVKPTSSRQIVRPSRPTIRAPEMSDDCASFRAAIAIDPNWTHLTQVVTSTIELQTGSLPKVV